MATLTLRNVPDDLYAELKEAAGRHRRSLNQEAIARLFAALNLPASTGSGDPALERARRVREALGSRFSATPEEIDDWINEGRP